MFSELKTTNEKFENPYSSFYPSLSVTFGAPQLLQIQTSYSKRVNRPRSRMINPFSSRQDNKNILVGNPFLTTRRPEIIVFDTCLKNIGSKTTIKKSKTVEKLIQKKNLDFPKFSKSFGVRGKMTAR